MGTGLGGVDPSDAARAMVDELRAHRQPKPSTVYLVDIDDEILLCLEEALRPGRRSSTRNGAAVKILVTCKRVPNPEHKLKIGGGQLDLAAASWQLNTFDEYAVETALRLTEKGKGGERSGEVVAVSIGPKDVGQQLRGVLAMGADRAILVGAEDAALDALARGARPGRGRGAREAGPGRAGQADRRR